MNTGTSNDFDLVVQELGEEYQLWCRKKRPALPEMRAELLRLALERRGRKYSRMDGQPLTAEDREHVRQGQRAGYRAARALMLEVEPQFEAQFWQLLSKFGIYPEGGLQ